MTYWDNPSWDEELIRLKKNHEPELPEDVLFVFLKRNPALINLIEKFDLRIEY